MRWTLKFQVGDGPWFALGTFDERHVSAATARSRVAHTEQWGPSATTRHMLALIKRFQKGPATQVRFALFPENGD